MPNFMPNKEIKTHGIIKGYYQERENAYSTCHILYELVSLLGLQISHSYHFPNQNLRYIFAFEVF